MGKENSFKISLDNFETQKFIEEVKNLPEKEKIEKIINSKYIGSKFEPIISTSSSKIEKFEVLLDINNDVLKTLGFSNKNVFLNKLEKHNLSKEITYKHLENIQYLELKSKNEETSILQNIQYSINVDSYEMTDKKFTDILNNLSPNISNKLQFEMLETIPIEFFSDNAEDFCKFKNYNKSDIEQRNEFFKLIKSSSIKINIDDLGSGFSNIQKIKRLIEIFNDGKNNKFHTVKLDKDIVLYNMLHSKLVSTKDNKERKKMIDETFNEYLKKDIFNALSDMGNNIKSENDLEKLKEKVSNMERDSNIYSIYTALMNHSNNNQEEFIKNLQNFNNTTEEKEKLSLRKKVMRERMFIIISETKDIVKCLANERKNLQLVREFGENPEVVSYMFEKFGQINQIQGYGLFDMKNLIQINNQQEFLNTEGIEDNFKIHEEKANVKLAESFKLLSKRYEQNKLYYKKLGMSNKQELNLLARVTEKLKIEDVANMSEKQASRLLKEKLHENNLKKRPKIENINQIIRELEFS